MSYPPKINSDALNKKIEYVVDLMSAEKRKCKPAGKAFALPDPPSDEYASDKVMIKRTSNHVNGELKTETKIITAEGVMDLD